MPEWRRDPISGERVIIAEGRLARPVDYPAPAVPPASGFCPFCEGNEATTPPEVAARRRPDSPPNGVGWRVRVIPNKFPTFEPGSGLSTGLEQNGGAQPASRAVGVHEVVIQTPVHSTGPAFLPPAQLYEVMEVYRERVRALEALAGVRSVLLAENWGPDSGGSLTHPHGQLLASPERFPALEARLSGSEACADLWKVPCAMEAIVERERREGSRVVVEDEQISAVTPFASTVPYQVRLIPRRHLRSIAQATDGELRSIATMLPALERALLQAFPLASYNVAALSPGLTEGPAPGFHFSIELLPRLAKPDAFELGAHVAVNPVPPEKAASDYRSWLAPTRETPTR